MTFKRSTGSYSFSNKIREIASSPENTVGGFLSKIFINVLAKRTRIDINHYPDQRTFLERWDALVVHYLSDPKNSIPQNKEALTAARGNLMKEIIKKSMTWKVWIKSLRVLQVAKIDFHFRFTLFNNEVIEHQATMNLGQIYVDDEQDMSFGEPIAKVDDNAFVNNDEPSNHVVPKSTIPESILG